MMKSNFKKSVMTSFQWRHHLRQRKTSLK